MATSLEKFVGVPLGEASRIAWFGFSADPPTLAHRSIIDAVMGSGIVQKIVVFPAGKLPYKAFKASDWQRMDMVEIWKASADFGDEVVISRFDLLRKEAMSWYELWNTIQKRSVKVQHSLVVGSDQYQEIPRSWNHGKELLKRASFIIVPRKGFDVIPLYENHVLIPVEPLPGSSTDARNGDFTTVDGKMKEYIVEQNLYT